MCLEPNQNVVEVALPPAARLLARPGGWYQGNYSDGHEAVCILGAIRSIYCEKIDGNYSKYWSGEKEAAAAIKRLVFALGNANVADYNDAPERTQAEVVTLCIKAGV